MDTQLASEIVVLLGRELKLVKKKVEDLERELSEEQSSRKAEKERADVAEYAMKASNLKAEKFGQENLKLRDELNLVRGVKQEEEQDIDLENLHRVTGRKIQANIICRSLDDFSPSSSHHTTVKLPASMGALVKELEDLKAAQKSQQEAESKWLKTRDDLERQLNDLTLEKTTLLQQLSERLSLWDEGEENEDKQEAEDDANEEGDSDTDIEDGEVSEERDVVENGDDVEDGEVSEDGDGVEEPQATPAIRDYMSEFPPFEGLPPSRLSSPVSLRNKQPSSYLTTHIGSGNFLYLPGGRIRWYGAKCHAIAWGPSFVFEQNRWEERSLFSKHFETTQELFFSRGSGVYYAGTYKCHQPPDFLPQTIALPCEVPAAAITDALRVPNAVQKTWANKPTLSKLFQHGILKLEYLVMECTGFNHRLYNRMLDKYEKQQNTSLNPTKRKRNRTRNPRKKRKIDS